VFAEDGHDQGAEGQYWDGVFLLLLVKVKMWEWVAALLPCTGVVLETDSPATTST